MKVLAMKQERETPCWEIQLIAEALKFPAVHRRCTSVCDRNVRRTGNVNICRRSKDQRRAINNFDRMHPPLSAVSGRNNICRSCSNIFPRARFYFHRRSSHPAFIMERAVKHTPPSALSAFNPSLFLPSTHSRPHGIKLSIWICIVWTVRRGTILVCVIQKWKT